MMAFVEANVVLTAAQNELAFGTKESALETYEECLWKYNEVCFNIYLNKNQLPAHIFVQAKKYVFQRMSVMRPSWRNAMLNWNGQMTKITTETWHHYQRLVWTNLLSRRRGEISKSNEANCEPYADPENDDNDGHVKQAQNENSEERKIVKKKGKKDSAGRLRSWGGKEVRSSISLRKAVYG